MLCHNSHLTPPLLSGIFGYSQLSEENVHRMQNGLQAITPGAHTLSAGLLALAE